MTMFETFIHYFNLTVIYGSVAMLLALGAACYLYGIDHVVRAFMRTGHGRMLLSLCTVTTAYAAVKFFRSVQFPRTDPDVQYIIDAGSYVTDDCAYIAFSVVALPSDARVLVAYAPPDATNESQVVTVADLTFAQWLMQFPGDDGAMVAAQFEWDTAWGDHADSYQWLPALEA